MAENTSSKRRHKNFPFLNPSLSKILVAPWHGKLKCSCMVQLHFNKVKKLVVVNGEIMSLQR